jgi:diacylglycerol kinase
MWNISQIFHFPFKDLASMAILFFYLSLILIALYILSKAWLAKQ